MKFNKQDLINMITEEVNETMGMGKRSSRDIMIANIYEMIDDIYGTKSLARRYKFSEMSDEEIHALHKEWEAQYDDWYNEQRVQDDLDMLAQDQWRWERDERYGSHDEYEEYERRKEEEELMMTPEEGEEFPSQLGMGKRIKNRKIRARLEEMAFEEYSDLLLEMFGGSMEVEKGDEYYHQRFPDMMDYGVIVKGEDGHTVLLQTMGSGFAPRVKPRQKFRMPKDLFFRTFIQKSNEIDPDTGKRINVINLSEGFQHHVSTKTPFTESIYRVGSDAYFKLMKEAREAYKNHTYSPLNEEEEEMLNSNLGEWAEFEGERVPLDFPMYIETLDEKKKKKKKKDPPIGKPTKNTGGGKKYKVYVRSPSGRIRKITYGDSKGGLKGNWNSAEARKSFASRHNCAEKKDRTKAGYWACRAHKDFGTNVPGRFW